ncbi:hypothetical protein [Collimonas sp.]|uniref:hypothetical protein n=1 Tax=Collimonas sp. TaxID=1963772 RepID=UPI002C166D1A|nr:hypothetical protein [Collimonas sp.]HWW08173.1 hypothetical protein [Collimonas sp.]
MEKERNMRIMLRFIGTCCALQHFKRLCRTARKKSEDKPVPWKLRDCGLAGPDFRRTIVHTNARTDSQTRWERLMFFG